MSMADKFTGGCDYELTRAVNDPLDNHVCRYSICKHTSGQDSISVVFFTWLSRAC